MRISDWSSDVCSAELAACVAAVLLTQAWAESHFLEETRARAAAKLDLYASNLAGALGKYQSVPKLLALHSDVVALFEASGDPAVQARAHRLTRSDERRVGTEWGSTCRSRWSPCHYKTKNTT